MFGTNEHVVYTTLQISTVNVDLFVLINNNSTCTAM